MEFYQFCPMTIFISQVFQSPAPYTCPMVRRRNTLFPHLCTGGADVPSGHFDVESLVGVLLPLQSGVVLGLDTPQPVGARLTYRDDDTERETYIN